MKFRLKFIFMKTLNLVHPIFYFPKNKSRDIIDNQFEDEGFLILGRLKFIFMRAKQRNSVEPFFYFSEKKII